MKSIISILITCIATTGTLNAADAFFTKARVYQQDRLSFLKQVRISNNLNSYRLDFAQTKQNSQSEPKFEIRLREPTVYFSFSRPLNDFLLISVNGMGHKYIEPKEKDFKLWQEKNRAGVSFVMNFDGAKITLSYWMRNDSPVLWGSITPVANSPEPVKEVILTYRFTPSKYVSNKLAGVYQHKIITPAKTYVMTPGNKWNNWQILTEADRYLVCMDEKYQADDKVPGQPSTGPCFICLDFDAIKTAKVDIRNYYMDILMVELKPDFKEYKFGIWESSKKFTNKDFLSYLSKNMNAFQLDDSK